MTEIERRVAATNATRLHFENRPFQWGKVDCAKVVAWHLRNMRGQSIGIAKAGTYRTALSARRALKRWGVDTLADALDAAGLERIAPAAALPGDIVALPGTDVFDALSVVAGNGAVLGFHEDSDTIEVMRLNVVPIAAWRA